MIAMTKPTRDFFFFGGSAGGAGIGGIIGCTKTGGGMTGCGAGITGGGATGIAACC